MLLFLNKDTLYSGVEQAFFFSKTVKLIYLVIFLVNTKIQTYDFFLFVL